MVSFMILVFKSLDSTNEEYYYSMHVFRWYSPKYATRQTVNTLCPSQWNIDSVIEIVHPEKVPGKHIAKKGLHRKEKSTSNNKITL